MYQKLRAAARDCFVQPAIEHSLNCTPPFTNNGARSIRIIKYRKPAYIQAVSLDLYRADQSAAMSIAMLRQQTHWLPIELVTDPERSHRNDCSEGQSDDTEPKN